MELRDNRDPVPRTRHDRQDRKAKQGPERPARSVRSHDPWRKEAGHTTQEAGWKTTAARQETEGEKRGNSEANAFSDARLAVKGSELRVKAAV